MVIIIHYIDGEDMKKIIIILFCFTLFLIFSHQDKIVIPKESIRFRIIANSNNEEDQQLKWQINEELIPVLMDITKDSSDIQEVRDSINTNLRKMDRIINKYTNNYQINYGQNYFPMKEFQNIIYPEGKYESLVISLGDALGDNWWCVLFPPLCLMEAQKENIDQIEYTTYISKVLNK